MTGHKETQKAQKGETANRGRLASLWFLCFSWPSKSSRRAIALFAILIAAAIAPAQENSSGSTKQAGKNEGKKAAARKEAKESPITPEKEAAVNAFVAEHHPELAELLRHLKGIKNQKPYERAIRELYTASERLAALQKSDSSRYELELNAWKVKSRIQLLSARLTMKDDEQLKNELKAALSEQYDIRREVLSLEKNRIQDRLQKLERDLADYDSRREEAIERQFKQLTSMPKNRPAAKDKTDKPARSKQTTGR
jgi:hypothetical protein